MGLVNIITSKHNSVSRDYLGRVTDPQYPKHKAATPAKQWGVDYWDGDRRTGYGGYNYVDGYWTAVAQKVVDRYSITAESKVLDIGCGKGFLLYEISRLVPGVTVRGLDISTYAVENCHPELAGHIDVGSCEKLAYEDEAFDLALSINVFHNLHSPELFLALKEITRVSRDSYVAVESYESELQKMNLLYWQLTCEAFFTPREWEWWFHLTGYRRDFEFIFFD